MSKFHHARAVLLAGAALTLGDALIAASPVAGSTLRSPAAMLLISSLCTLAVALTHAARLAADALAKAAGAQWRALLVFALTGLALWPVGAELVEGAWISGQRLAPLLRYGLPLVGGGLAAGTLHLLDEARPRGLYIGLGLFACLLLVVEAAWLPRGDFARTHLANFAVVSALASLASTGLLGTDPRRPGPLALIWLGLVLLGGALWFAMPTQLRAELATRQVHAGTLLRAFAPAHSGRLARMLLTPAAAPTEPPPSEHPPTPLPRGLILITVDALRADALPPVRDDSGHPTHAGDTPFIDEFAARSVTFSRAHAQASKTVDSLPAMLRSLHPYDDLVHTGWPLARVLNEAGFRGRAVVNEWFFEARLAPTRALLEDFEAVSIYAPSQTNDAVERTLAALDELPDQRYFVWLHLYSSHDPGYAGRQLSSKDGSWPERYRQSVRWLDGELSRLWSGLEARGLASEALVILASDHGEGLGDNGVERHGDTVMQEEIHVPLFIRAPGLSPRRIDASVGNIDIVPTIHELLGLPASPLHRGHSLWPLLAGHTSTWGSAYFARDRYNDALAWIEGAYKTIHSTKSGTTLRFDLERDPDEDDNLFDGGAQAQAALDRLLRCEPSSLRPELDDEQTLSLFRARLAAMSAASPAVELDFLLRLAGSAEVDDIVAGLFSSSSDEELRLRILRHRYARAPARYGPALRSWIEGLPDPSWLLERLALQGQLPFEPQYCAAQLREAIAERPEQARAWLRMMERWRVLPFALFAPGVLAALESPQTELHEPALRLATGLLPPADEAQAAALIAAVEAHLYHPHPEHVRAAVETLSSFGSALDSVHALLIAPDTDLRARQAGLRALASKQGVAALPTLEAAAADPRMQSSAILACTRIHDPATLETLARIAKLPLHRSGRENLRRARRELARHSAGR